MPRHLQADRPLRISTPLGQDILLITRLRGVERISELFRFEAELLAENDQVIRFERLLGQRITVSLDQDGKHTRYFSGICSRIGQGLRDQFFTSYRMEIVPEFWFLTKRVQIRIFEHQTVPEILKEVLKGLKVDDQGIRQTYSARDYCVQYRESDFAFASRIMEEEGIFYYFRHEEKSHTLVLSDQATSHPEVPGPAAVILFDESRGGLRHDSRITRWDKYQEIRSGKVTLWDHTFELPTLHLEADQSIGSEVKAGEVDHKIAIGRNDVLEIYDFPANVAKWYDGVDKSGGDQHEELNHNFEQNKREAELRMQALAIPGLVIDGESDCGFFIPGHAMTLERHFNADGRYLLTRVEHDIRLGEHFRSGGPSEMIYKNRFQCIPVDVPFRPERRTPRPTIHGTQTAVVVGPEEDEIFTDKYGRVRVQFHWDRFGEYNGDRSCWIRVAQIWAGRRWGASFWPRVGQEVVIAFEEGDPDQPIIIGSVYNAAQMPPYLGAGPDPRHKNDNKLSGIKSNSTPGGDGFNEWRFDDTKGNEQVFIHAQNAMDVRVRGTSTTTVGGSVNVTNGGVDKNGKKYGDYKQLVNKDLHLHVKGDSRVLTEGKESHIVQGDAFDWYRSSHRTTTANEEFTEAPKIVFAGGEFFAAKGDSLILTANKTISLSAPTIVLDGTQTVSIKGPGGFVVIDATGVTIVGTPMVKINSGGGPPEAAAAFPLSTIGSGAIGDTGHAEEPKDPGSADHAKTGLKSRS